MDDSAFLKTVGSSPVARVLDFLITNYDFDYSVTEISEKSNVGWTTLHKFWNGLAESGLIKNTRVVGNSRMYMLNLENPVAKELVSFSFNLAKIYGEWEIERQRRKS